MKKRPIPFARCSAMAINFMNPHLTKHSRVSHRSKGYPVGAIGKVLSDLVTDYLCARDVDFTISDQNHLEPMPNPPPNSLHQLLYWSRSALPMDATQLDKLLKCARERNMKESVTGFLLFDTSIFMQLLEGPREAVDRIFASIRKDARHKSILVLHNDRSDVRAFPTWSMAYHLIKDKKLTASGGSLSAYVLKGVALQLQKQKDEISESMARYILAFIDIEDAARRITTTA